MTAFLDLADRLATWRGDPADLIAELDEDAARRLAAHVLARRPAWMSAAECARPEHRDVSFHPVDGVRPTAALAICSVCPVVDECLAYALATEIHPQGVWGGTVPAQRRAMRAMTNRPGLDTPTPRRRRTAAHDPGEAP